MSVEKTTVSASHQVRIPYRPSSTKPHHFLLSKEEGRVVQDDEVGVEEMVTRRAKADVVEYYNRDISEL